MTLLAKARHALTPTTQAREVVVACASCRQPLTDEGECEVVWCPQRWPPKVWIHPSEADQ